MDERLQLLHDLQVHQEEIHVQNDQLIAAQAALEESRDRYVDLYDFAPNGYLTLDANGVVLQINLTAASFFGKAREKLTGLPLLGFVAPGGRGDFLDFMRKCRGHSHGANPVVDLRVRTGDGDRHVQLLCRPRGSASKREYLIAMLDINERKVLEASRQAAAQEHAALIERLMSVQEHERRRIAREIHDHLGQQLTSLRLKLELLAQDPASGPVLARVHDAQDAAEQLDEHLDFFTGKLRPAALDDLGLVAALSQFVREWSDNFHIPAEFHSAGFEDRRIVPDVETHIYRFCQEALNNVYKHSGATRAAVILERRDGHMFLIIEDNGKGLLPAQSSRGGNGGLGLVGMRERAALVNGTMEIESAPGRGTTVFLQLPVTAALRPAVSGPRSAAAPAGRPQPATPRRRKPRQTGTARSRRSR
jgi:PAS domain S-box-containing protein